MLNSGGLSENRLSRSPRHPRDDTLQDYQDVIISFLSSWNGGNS